MSMINIQKGPKVRQNLRSLKIQKYSRMTKFETQSFSCLTTSLSNLILNMLIDVSFTTSLEKESNFAK